MKNFAFAAAAALTLLASNAASAQTIYNAQDDGSAVGGPNVNSSAAEVQFLADAATYGPVSTLTFDRYAVSDVSSYSFPGVTITTDGGQYGAGYSGITGTTFGNLYGYDISAGGVGNWFGGPGGSITFTFAAPTNSFGFYTTGLQTQFGTDFSVTIDGTVYTPLLNDNGGATYFGFTDPTAFSSVVITRLAGDAWGLDSISFNLATPSVPEPTTWVMMIAGFGAVGGTLRSRRRAATLATA